MQRALTLRLSGRAVSDGKVAVTDLARIVERLEQAIGHLTRGGTEGVARKPRFVLTRIGQGSCVTELELDGPASDALEGFHVEPLEQLVSGASEPDGLLPGDAAETIAALRMDLPRGIDWIEFVVRFAYGHCANRATTRHRGCSVVEGTSRVRGASDGSGLQQQQGDSTCSAHDEEVNGRVAVQQARCSPAHLPRRSSGRHAALRAAVCDGQWGCVPECGPRRSNGRRQ